MSLAFSGTIVKGEKGREYSELEEIASDGSLQFHGLGDELPLFPSIAISSIDCNLYLKPGKHHFLWEVLELSLSGEGSSGVLLPLTEPVGFSCC